MIEFSPLETLFANTLLPDGPSSGRLFLAYLMAASRRGHLCVIVEANKVFPDPRAFWGAAVDLSELIKGLSQLPESLFSKTLRREGRRVYLQRNWTYETSFLKDLQRLSSVAPTLSIPESVEISSRCTAAQSAAVRKALNSTVSIISGGPGTGKTFTAGQLVQAAVRRGLRVALAAPTGKAAARLGEALVDDESLQASTLHSLLDLRNDPPVQISADLILVDECSMIDVRMMAVLFASVPTGARLVLLGDRDQLPPVESGSLFGDLVFLRLVSATCELDECLRVESPALMQLAADVRRGRISKALDGEGVRRIALDRQVICGQVVQAFCGAQGECADPERLLAAFQSYRVLSPLRKGPFGVDTLNALCHEMFLYASRSLSVTAVPIMVSANDYHLKLFNGEVGILVLDAAGHYALFPSAGVRQFPRSILPPFEYAYCLSVHKSQGSEFDRVTLVLPEGSERFGRELLYTGITRARRELEIAGSKGIVEQMVRNRVERVSGLAEWAAANGTKASADISMCMEMPSSEGEEIDLPSSLA